MACRHLKITPFLTGFFFKTKEKPYLRLDYKSNAHWTSIKHREVREKNKNPSYSYYAKITPVNILVCAV